MRKMTITAIAASCMLCASTVLACAAPKFSASAQVDSNTDVKIMALGDSITDGYWTSGGYRKYLYHAMEQKGYSNIDMVGPKGGNNESFTYSGSTVSYDGNYAGYSGYAIQYMTGTETRQGILETITATTYGNGSQNMMEAYDPDIVLLQIGTNDILSAYNSGISNRLENLVDTLLPYLTEDGDMLFLSTIPDIDVETVYSWFWAYGSEYYGVDQDVFTAKVQDYIDTYNASIRQLVEQKQAEGAHIQFADINSVVDTKTDLYDGIHPNEIGYEKMGLYWASQLDTYLGGNGIISTQPVQTTTTSVSAATTTTTTSSTTKTTTTSSSEKTTVSTTATTTSSIITEPSKESVVLSDVSIGTAYNLTEYQDLPVSSISFTFSGNMQYGMNGCVAFGNWEKYINYTQDDVNGFVLTIPVEKMYNMITIYKWHGDVVLDTVTLHYTSENESTSKPTTTSITTTTVKPTTTSTTTTTAKPTTTSTTTTTTKPTTTSTITTTTKPTTTSTTTTTAKPTTTSTTTTTAKPTTTSTTTTTAKPTTTSTTTTTAKPTTSTPTTTTTAITTSTSEKNTVVLTDVAYGKSYSLKDYDYTNIEKIEIQLNGAVGYGFGGCLVLGDWAVKLDYSAAVLTDDNTIIFEIESPQSKFTLFNYWGSMGLESVTLHYE